MENTNNWNSAQEGADQQANWQQAENNENETSREDANDELDLRSAEADGYGATAEDTDERLYAAADKDDEDDEDDEAENDDDEEEDADTDWGEVDPQSGGTSDMDPSGPGSAV